MQSNEKDTTYGALVEEKDDQVSEKHFTIQNATEYVGFGKFQVLMMLMVGFFWTADAMEIMVVSILSPILACEWNLSSLQEALISTIVFFGQGVGNVGIGYLSDVFGRKKALCGSVLVVVLFGIISSQAPSYEFILLCRFLVGFGLGGTHQAVIILTEVLPVHRRGAALIFLSFFWSAGSSLAAALALAVVNTWGWRYYLLILSSPLLTFLISSWWIPESPRYLLVSGQQDELNALMIRIAKTNGKKVPEKHIREGQVTSRGRILDLFTKEWRHTTRKLTMLWFAAAFCYFGIPLLTTAMFQSGINSCSKITSLNSTAPSSGCKKLTSADYKDFTTTTLAEFPGLLISLISIDKIGRKLCLAIQFGAASVAIGLLMVCTSRTVLVVFIFIARALLASTFQAMFVYTAEVYPTNMRAVGMGCCSMFGRFASILTPFVAQMLIKQSFYGVVAVYSVPLLFSAITSLALKTETNQKPLEDSSALVLRPFSEDYQTFQ